MSGRFLARFLVLAAASLVLAACPQPRTGRIEPRGAAGNSGKINFGLVYVGLHRDRTLRIDEIDGVAVDIIGSLIDGIDPNAFARVPPGALSQRVPASGNINVTLRFSPTEARPYGRAEFTVFALNKESIGFPVVLEGFGVHQKQDGSLQVVEGSDPDEKQLDFGSVQIGQQTDRMFQVRNLSNQDMSVTLTWLSSSPAFSNPTASDTHVIRANSVGGVTLRFRPPQPGHYQAVVELRQGLSYAGIVLAGEGVTASSRLSDVSMTPRTIDPGQTITLRYSLSHPVSLNEVKSILVEGLPPNTPGGSTMLVPKPSLLYDGLLITEQLRIGPPALDGIYPLTLRIRHVSAQDTTFPLGDLTVRDVPATIDNVVVRSDRHSRSECETPFVTRNIEYRVRDDNGAIDVYAPRIDAIQPPEDANPLTRASPVAPIPLATPTNWDLVEDTATSRIDVNCKAKAQAWTLVVRVDEDDKTTRPPTQIQRFRQPVTYTVSP